MHLRTGAILETRAWPIFMFYFRTSPREKARFCEILLRTRIPFFTTAQDDALDVLDIVLTDIFSEASKAGIKARLRTLKDLDAAAVQAGNVSKVVLDPNVADIEIRQTVFKLMSRLDLDPWPLRVCTSGFSSAWSVAPSPESRCARGRIAVIP